DRLESQKCDRLASRKCDRAACPPEVSPSLWEVRPIAYSLGSAIAYSLGSATYRLPFRKCDLSRPRLYRQDAQNRSDRAACVYISHFRSIGFNSPFPIDPGRSNFPDPLKHPKDRLR
ncbi:MAG: hypothetical protein P5700_24860, partial [Arthrospira platensis PCC 7345]|nr:hypothetical protein [Arthrospira platensis PCC 7345]